jgi:nitric oxide dioxygenase
MLTSTDIALVRASFGRVATMQDTVTDLFYERLFVIAPKLRALFPVDMSQQKRKLMQMITAAVGGLDGLDGLVPAVKELGARHVGYGVTSADYVVVGEALQWTLEQVLGDAFTPAVRSAWANVYGVLAATMQAGAADMAGLHAAE